MLEPCAGKLACTVLRGRDGGDAVLLPDLDKGAYVRKGEKGTPVIFAKKLTFNEGDEDERKIFMHRSFTVFNVAQIEELPKKEVSESIIPEDAASTFVAAILADIRVGGDMAGYIPSKDYITLPPATAFKSMESYYATTLHELGHNAEPSVMPRRSRFTRKTRANRRWNSA